MATYTHEPISRLINSLLSENDLSKPLFIALNELIHATRNSTTGKFEQKSLEKVLHSMDIFKQDYEDVANFEHRKTLTTASINFYLKSLGHKASFRKLLEALSSLWHSDLIAILQVKVDDLLTCQPLTNKQIYKVSIGLEDSKLFREAVEKNLVMFLTRVEHLMMNEIRYVTLPSYENSTREQDSARGFVQSMTQCKLTTNPSIDTDINNPVCHTVYSTQTKVSQTPLLNHTEMCYTCLKLCLQVFQYMPQSVGHLFWQETSSEHFQLTNIINCLQTILSQYFNRDCNLLTGSALSMMLNTIPMTTQAMLVAKVLLGDNNSVSIGNTQVSRPSQDITCSPFFKIALIRGMITCCKPKLQLFASSEGDPIFLHSLFFDVIDICRGLMHSKLYNAFQLLVLWFEGAKATLDLYVSSFSDSKSCFHGDSMFVMHTLQLIWENWQSPLTGVSGFVKTTFGLLLEIHNKENILLKISDTNFYGTLAKHLLQTSWHIKGKYTLLASLVPYIGALNLLTSHPTLPRQIVRGLATNFLASPISHLHKVLLQNMKKEIEQMGIDTQEKDDAVSRWNHIWGDCVLDVLCSEHELVRFHAAQYWLPWILKIFPGAYTSLMMSLENGAKSSSLSPTRVVHAYVMLMAQARQSDILDFSVIEENKFLIWTALHHIDDDIRLSALVLICNCPKRSEVVRELELEMLYIFLPQNLNCDGASFRQMMCTYVKIIVTRTRDSCLASLKTTKKRGTAQDKLVAEANLVSGIDFIDWLVRTLMGALFPGACYQRKKACLTLLGTLFEVMLARWHCNKRKGHTPETTDELIKWAHQHNKCQFVCERHCSILLDGVLDGSNDIREAAYEILSIYFPWPFPGSAGNIGAVHVLTQGLQLICSPKAPQCEAGALLCKLVFQRHILEGKANQSQHVVALEAVKILKEGHHGALTFLRQLTDSLEDQLKHCTQNILYGSSRTPMHGLLLAIRKCLNTNMSVLLEIMKTDRAGWETWIYDFLATASSIVSLSMSVLGGSTGGTELSPSFADIGEAIDELVLTFKNSELEAKMESFPQKSVEHVEDISAMSSEYQHVVSCCWLSIKEVSVLLGEMAQCLPFQAETSEGLLSTKQLQTMTGIFVKILTKCRHKGAIEGCSVGFTKLCTSLLASESLILSTFPKKLVEDVIEMINTEGSTSSFTKMSGGLPLLLEALLNSEPRGKEKGLLHFAMTELLKIAQRPEPVEHDQTLDLPQCHALNILKALFRSSAINDDVMPYTSQCVIVTIHGFASKHFSIRNASMLLFGSLVARMFGQKRVQDEHSQVNSTTACEFFVHYPTLQQFLLDEISKCIQQQETGKQSLHPSLFPVLTILSKLGCGLQNGETSILVQFITPVMQLCNSPVYQVRALAAQALVPLIAEDQILQQASSILQSLPTTWQHICSHNHLHGKLLNIQKLVEAYISNAIGEINSFDLQNIVKQLYEHQWICTKENRCPLTRAVFIDTASNLISWFLSKEASSEANSLAEVICSIAQQYLAQQHPHQIADAVLARSMVQALLSLNSSQIIANVQCLLKSTSDVVVPALQFLLKELRAGALTDVESLRLFVLDLVDQITCNVDQACLETSLNLFVEFSKACDYKVHMDWPFLWNDILKLASGSQGVSVSCAALPALSVVVKGMFNNKDMRYDMQAFCRLIVTASDSRLSESSRLAVASALQIVGEDILEESCIKNKKTVSCAMSIFTSALNLLQDEQREVRCEASKFVSYLSKQDDKKLKIIQPYSAIKVLIKYICCHFNWSCVCLTGLCSLLRGSNIVGTAARLQLTTGSVNLFEQEDANIYAEPAQLATLIHTELEKFVKSFAEEDHVSFESWLLNDLKDAEYEMQMLQNELKTKYLTCASFFGVSGFTEPYHVILRRLLHIQLLVSATCLLHKDVIVDLTSLHTAAVLLAKTHKLHPYLQDKLRIIINLTEQCRDEMMQSLPEINVPNADLTTTIT